MIRAPEPREAPTVLAMLAELDSQTRFMMLEPGERDLDPNRFADWLARLSIEDDCYLVVFDGDRVLGFIHAERGSHRRSRHSAYLVLGLLAEARGLGWGRRLLAAVDEWAAGVGVHRLELTVMVHNQAAIGLYRRCGYQEEGVRRCSLIVDGECVDELAMAKLLDLSAQP